MTTKEERCERSELLKSQCAHCRPKTVVSVEPDFTALLEQSQTGPWVIAKYPGNCSVCGERFEEQDYIRADGSGGWQARDCCGEDH